MTFFNFTRHRYTFFLISALIILPGLISLVLPGGLRPGIDFTSGSIMTLRFERGPDQTAVRQAFADLGQTDAIVQSSNDGTFVVRTRPLATDSGETDANGQPVSGRQVLEDGLVQRLGPVTFLSFDQVSPIIAQEIVRYAILAV